MRPSLQPIVASVLFLLALCAPGISRALNIAVPQPCTTTASACPENRMPAAFPSLQSARTDWAGFPAAIEAWMKDHMGLRTQLVQLDLSVRSRMRLSTRLSAIRGDDGWLFDALDKSLETHQGLRPYTDRQTQVWLETAAEMQTRADAAGAAFVVLIAPNKHSIYPEHLDTYPVLVPGPRPAQALAAAAPSRGLTLIYPEQELLAAKDQHPAYYQTDTHWTVWGAFAAYLSFIERARQSGVEVTAVDEDQLSLSQRATHLGDLNGLLGITDAKPEVLDSIQITSPRTFSQIDLPQYDWMSFKAYRQTMEGSEGPRILVYGDSFFDALAPFLRESFSEITFVHHRNGAPPLSAMEEDDYDLVVLEMVERTLIHPLAPSDLAPGRAEPD